VPPVEVGVAAWSASERLRAPHAAVDQAFLQKLAATCELRDDADSLLVA